jgi:hypothetical protein
MRVLICSSGGAGHLRPMMPLARALVRRGHQVAWSTAPDALADLAPLGVVAFPAGHTTCVARRLYRSTWPEAETLDGEALGAHTFPRLFGGVIAPAMLPDLSRAVERWKPDLVVSEPAALAARLVCAKHRVMHLEHGFGLPPPAGSIEHAMRELRQRLPDPGWRGIRTEQAPAYLDIVPPGLHAAGPPPNTVHTMRPIDAATATTQSLPASWRRALESRAVKIHVTFGTVFNKRHALRLAVAAAARLNAQVFVTVGRDGDPSDLGPLPSSVHVERFVDQAGLYAACDVTLSHGGAGALLAAAAHGKPHVVLPQAADHFRNGRALEAAGAGVVVPPDGCTVEVVETALRAALDSSAVQHAARRLAAEVTAMPEPEAVAEQFEHGVVNAPGDSG